MAAHGELSRRQLFILQDDGTRSLIGPEFEHSPLHNEVEQVRLLTLYPVGGDVNDLCNFVKCDLETFVLSEAPPFVAVENARGYRLSKEPIEVNGSPLLVSTALERFLRNFRTRIEKPTKVYVRHICNVEWDVVEKERYWTREFSDRMYAMATDVVAMDAFNARLVDTEIVKKVIDSRYQFWRKEWWDLPQELVLPKVFPIKLGKKASNEVPVEKYQYVPLDLIADEIRVMVLVPSTERSAPLVLHIAHCPIKCEVTFTALSYRWGTDSTQVEIVLNGQKMSIRKSLAEILRAIRHTEEPALLWIDQISIDQRNIVERNRQVRRMGEIYDNAAAVVCHLGDSMDGFEMGLNLIHELQQPMVRFNDKGEWHFGSWGSNQGESGLWYGENRLPPERLDPMLAALYRFLTRPYFRRVWVAQETAFASNPRIAVGSNSELSFEKLDTATYNFESMLRADPTIPGRIMRADLSVEHADVEQLTFPRKLFYFRHLKSQASREGIPKGDEWVHRFAKIDKMTPGFLETLVLTRSFESTDPRDKIYSLWNLAQDKVGLNFGFDYANSTERVYTDFAGAWITQHRSLDILGAVELVPESASFYETAPSWCPDWQVASSASCFVRRERIPNMPMFTVNSLDGALYAADGGMNRDSFDVPLFSLEDDNTVLCTGIVLDQVDFTFEQPGEIPHGMTFPLCDPPSYHRFQHWTAAIEEYFERHALSTYDDPARAATAMFHGDNEATWPLREDNLEMWDGDELEAYVCIPATSRNVPWYGGSYCRVTAWDAVKMTLRGRRPFVSRNGYIGLMPSYLELDPEKPLMLACVATCTVPLLLRERLDGSYQLCGTAFVQGWMDGEVMENMMGAESPWEFWDAVRENAKIKIS